MSRTRKDSRHVTGTVLEIVKTGDEEFDIFVNKELVRHYDLESSLSYDLRVRYGYCQEELTPIIHELNLTGRKTIVF
jgi:hypothetical protein